MEVLEAQGLVPHSDPGGRRIGHVHVVVQDVFTAADPFPDWLNAMHHTTEESVVRRELLLDEGDVFDLELLQESARNLRALLIFSVVLILPVESMTDPEEVDLLVFAKDLFSLRLEWNFHNTGGSFDFLSGALTERNIGGLAKEGRFRFGFDRGSYKFGELYLDRRLLGSRWTFYELVDVTFPRASQGGGGPEGTAGEVAFIRPLATTATRWGYQLDVTWDTGVTRRFYGDDLLRWDDPATADVEALPWAYDHRRWTASALVVRSFGGLLKTDFGLGYGRRNADYQLRQALPPEQRAPYDEWLRLPVSEDAGYGIGRIHHYANRHATMADLDSFAITEDVRLGHELDLVVRPAHPLLGSDEAWVELDSLLGYNLLVGDRGDLLQLSFTARSRRQQGRWINNRVGGSLKNFGPPTRWGRAVYRLGAEFGWDDQDQTVVSVGGDSSLRGYLAGSRLGTSAVRQNLEWRSRSLDLSTIQLGWALFWDAGDAFDDIDRLEIRHSVGGGLRLLLPQTNRNVLRLDFAVPLNGSETGVGGWFSFAFLQAF